MLIDGFVHQLPDIDPSETTEWLDSLDSVIDVPRPGPRPLPAGPPHGAGPGAGRRRPRDGHHGLHQHDPTGAGALVPRRRGAREARPRRDPVERDGDGRPREPSLRRPRRAPLDVRVRRGPLRRRASTTSSTARATAASATRSSSRVTPHPASTPARSSRGASTRSSSTASAARSSAAGCRATRTRGACPSSGSSRRSRWASGPLNAVYQARFNRYLLDRELVDTAEAQGLVLRRGRRDGRARGHGRAVARGPRAARQPDLRRELQPAAPRRAGARQRQGHPGARGDVPRRRLERDQGDLGPRVGRAARP